MSACHSDLGLDEKRFACDTDDDCVPGWVCDTRRMRPECIPASEIDASVSDTEQQDTSRPDTAGGPDTYPLDTGHLDTGQPDTSIPCTADCSSDEICCGSVCADPDRDVLHCGACNNACLAGTTCVSGECIDDTCPRLTIESIVPAPGTVVLPDGDGQLEWSLTFSCPIRPESFEEGMSIRGSLSGQFDPTVTIESNSVTITSEGAIRGERLSLHLTGIETTELDVLGATALEHFFVAGAPSNGSFGPGMPVITGLDGVRDLAVAEFDGERENEIAVLAADRVVIAHWDRDTLTGTTAFDLPISDGVQLALGDLDDDGDTDVWIVRARATDQLLVNETVPGAALSFSVHSFDDMPDDAGIVALGDVDLDGLADAAVIFETPTATRMAAIWHNEGGFEGDLEILSAPAGLPDAVVATAVGAVDPSGARGALFAARDDLPSGDRHFSALLWDANSLVEESMLTVAASGGEFFVEDVALLGMGKPSVLLRGNFPGAGDPPWSPVVVAPLTALTNGNGIAGCPTSQSERGRRGLGAPADVNGLRQLDVVVADETLVLGVNSDIENCGTFRDDVGRTETALVDASIGDFIFDDALDIVAADDTGVYVFGGNDSLRLLDSTPPAGGVLDTAPASVELLLDRAITEGPELWPGNTLVTIRGEQSGVHPASATTVDGATVAVQLDPGGPPFIAGERVHVTLRYSDLDPAVGGYRAPIVWSWRLGGQAAELSRMGVGLKFDGAMTSADSLTAPIVGLFNADERPDLAVGSTQRQAIVTVLNDGSELSVPDEMSFIDADPRLRSRPAAQDVHPVDGGASPDGDLDWVIGLGPFAPVVANDGTGRFPLMGNFFETEGVETAGDVDGNGMLDYVFGEVWLSGLSSMTYVHGASGESMSTLLDVDLDRHLDLVSHDVESGSLSVRLNSGSHIPMPEFEVPTQTVETSNELSDVNRLDLLAADLDGDRDDDVALISTDASSTWCELFENRDGQLTSRGKVALGAVGTEPVRLAAADFDGDTALELVIALTPASGSGTRVTFYDVVNSAPLADLSEIASHATDMLVRRLVPTDWNGDGVVDLVVSGEPRIEVWLSAPK